MQVPEEQSAAIESVERRLTDEFDGAVPLPVIDMVAAEEVGKFDAARIRDYIPILAWRQARDRLRQRVSQGTT